MRNFVFTFVLIFAESFFTPLLAADLIDNCLFVVEDTICSNPDREPNIEGCEDLYYRCLNQQIVMRGKGKKGFLHIIIEFIINNYYCPLNIVSSIPTHCRIVVWMILC